MSDCTPLDTDVEKVLKKGKTLKDTIASLSHAPIYCSSNTDGKKLGKIMLVFSKDNFIETRNQNDEVSKENIELLEQDSSKKEVYLLDKETFKPIQKFFSCGDAAKFIGCTTSTLAKHCRGETDSCMNKLLCYVENYEERKKIWEENKTAINLNRNIYIYKDNKLVGTANTYAEASRFVGGTGKSANISRIMNGKGTYKGHTFYFKNEE